METMMPRFSQASRTRLETCHPDLIRIFERVILGVDCTILEGHRGKVAQNEAVRTGHSHIRWPNGNHNSFPSRAVDAAPYPIDWDDTERFVRFAYYVLGVAAGMGIPIRWGGDWDGDWDMTDQRLVDMPHYELILPSPVPPSLL
jgi:hypothetical protein